MFEIEHLEPKLEHNRRESKVLSRRIWQSAAVAVALVVPMGVITPPDRAAIGVGLWMGAFMIVLGYLQVRKAMVFQRDLREQRTNPVPKPPE